MSEEFNSLQTQLNTLISMQIEQTAQLNALKDQFNQAKGVLGFIKWAIGIGSRHVALMRSSSHLPPAFLTDTSFPYRSSNSPNVLSAYNAYLPSDISVSIFAAHRLASAFVSKVADLRMFSLQTDTSHAPARGLKLAMP